MSLRLSLRTSNSFWEREGFAGLGTWSILVVQLEQHVIYRLMAGGGQGGPSYNGRNWQKDCREWKLTKVDSPRKGAPGDQMWDLLCLHLASYLEGGPLISIMPLHLHINQISNYDDIWCMNIFQNIFSVSSERLCKSKLLDTFFNESLPGTFA